MVKNLSKDFNTLSASQMMSLGNLPRVTDLISSGVQLWAQQSYSQPQGHSVSCEETEAHRHFYLTEVAWQAELILQPKPRAYTLAK